MPIWLTSSVIVSVINVNRVSVFKQEGHPPIPRYRDGEAPGEWICHGVQPKAWQVHILRVSASVEHREDANELADMLRSHPSRAVTVVERPQSSVLERTDHNGNLWRSLSLVN